eukprot:6181849-Pleurochrysis_carterae.AAC.4
MMVIRHGRTVLRVAIQNLHALSAQRSMMPCLLISLSPYSPALVYNTCISQLSPVGSTIILIDAGSSVVAPGPASLGGHNCYWMAMRDKQATNEYDIYSNEKVAFDVAVWHNEFRCSPKGDLLCVAEM